MEELEDATEKLKEINEAAEEMFEQKERWTLNVALSTAVIAVLAAIAGLIGNHHANEAMLEQIKASDKWAYYQSKSIKTEIAASTAIVLNAIGKPGEADTKEKTAKYNEEKAEIKKDAEGETANSEMHMRKHVQFAYSVTIFQVAIAVSAISILTRKKQLWYACLALSAVGCVFLILGFLIK